MARHKLPFIRTREELASEVKALQAMDYETWKIAYLARHPRGHAVPPDEVLHAMYTDRIEAAQEDP